MKKLFYVFTVTAIAFATQGCSSNSKDSKEAADSINMVKDTSINSTSIVGLAVEPSDAEFATAAAVAGMTEVEMGKLAISRAMSTPIKEFAAIMVTDHGKANEDLKSIAETKNITLPKVPDAQHQKEMEDLNKKNGSDFDKDYAEAMISGHKKTLKLMQDQAKNGKDHDLREFALKIVPIVQEHLDMIKKIRGDMK